MRNATGFTLIESLVVIAIFTLMLSFLIPLFLQYSRYQAVQQGQADVVNSADSIQTAVQAALVPADAVASSHSFSGTTYNSATTSLVLQSPSIATSGAIISGSYDYIGFYATGTNAYEIIDSASTSARTKGTQIIGNYLSSLSFVYNATPNASSTAVDLTVKTSESSHGLSATTTVHEKTYLRN